LIVNADDFGMTSGINRAIAVAHRHGIVTSATLMASGAAFHEAVQLARNNPELKVGCHVSLVQGDPMLPAATIPTLALAASGRSSPRYQGFGDFASAVLLGRINPEEIAREAEAQFRRLQAAGIEISHFDTHKHLHALPPVLRPLLQAARECGIRALRCPFEPAGSTRAWQALLRPRLWKRLPVVAFLRRYQPEFRRLAAQFGLATTDGTLGITVTGCLNEALLDSLLRRLPEGTWELVCHPAYVDSQLRSLSTLRTGEAELRALTSEAIRGSLARSSIELASYADVCTWKIGGV
jgi:hopanoid biosynthesis associated protein HpnK